MCGIAVNFSFHGPAMCLPLERLRHRGPDGIGEWRSPGEDVWLGHTRLAILDLSPAGAQPMIDPDTGNAVVFNGEIYNHRQLRGELNEWAPSWRGSSDTETLLVAYRHWGEDLPKRLKGMFAFAIYDAGRKEVFVARDRLGIKPLYYRWNREDISLASETRALGDGRRLPPTKTTISDYLAWGACPETQLIDPSVRSFPAGHWAFLRRGGGLRPTKYWPSQSFAMSCAETPKIRVRQLLERSVKEHLLADVPVGCFLSGGIDSSILTALAARNSPDQLRTFTVGFRQVAYDETERAASVARKYNTEHQRIELGESEILPIVKEAVARLDLPSVDAINTYIVAKTVAERGIKVALSGLGGDELFGGYPSFCDVPRLKWLARQPWLAKIMASCLGSSARRLEELPRGGVHLLANWRRRLWTDRMLADAGLPLARVEDSGAPAPDLPDDFARISWTELTGYMRHLLLRDSDQMSMAVSLELRVPFLDHELVEYALSLCAREKRKYPGVKGLLVEACRDLLPEGVYRAPKRGFGLPMNEWMRGPLRSYVEEAIQTAVENNWIEKRSLERLWQSFLTGRLHWTRLWSLVVLAKTRGSSR